MSPPANIARRLAKRFAPEMGPRLPAAVERALADAEGGAGPFRSADPNQIIAFATLVVTLAGTMWTVHMGQWQKRQAIVDAEKLKQENALLKDLLLAQLKDGAPRPAQIDDTLRTRLLEAAADETITEATQQERRG